MLARSNRDPIAAPESALSDIEQLKELLEDPSCPVSVRTSAHGEVTLPVSVVRLLAEIADALTRRSAVSVIELHQELTTNQAASLLNVSRQYLVRLLDAGEINFSRTGTHRRLRLQDVLEYRRRRDAARTSSLAELSQLSQDMGLYE